MNHSIVVGLFTIAGVVLGGILDLSLRMILEEREKKRRQAQLFFNEKKTLYEDINKALSKLNITCEYNGEDIRDISLTVGEWKSFFKSYIEEYQGKLLLYGSDIVIKSLNKLREGISGIKSSDLSDVGDLAKELVVLIMNAQKEMREDLIKAL